MRTKGRYIPTFLKEILEAVKRQFHTASSIKYPF